MTKKLSYQQLKDIDREKIIHPQSVPKQNADEGPSMIYSKGDGIRVTDMDGGTYIDGVSMLWNVNLGHGQSELATAAYEQMNEFAYGSQFYGNSNEPAIRLADKITEYAPGDLDGVFFTSGGSESNDTAFKLSRFYWQLQGFESKKIIISLKRGYHGVTVSAQRATGIEAFREFSGSGDPHIINAKAHLTAAEQGDRTSSDFEKSIRGLIEQEGADNVAAVILEPVQGAGGVHLPPDGYLQAVRNLCDEQNVLMIADEVICGFGRTGKNFAVEHWNVTPDMISFAKGVTSGYFPLGGVIMRAKVKEAIAQYDQMLAHGFTYSGHPTGCAVALKNLEIIEREGIVDHVTEMEKELQKGLHTLQEKHKCMTKSRAIGLLAGFDLMKDPEADQLFENDVKAAETFVKACRERNLILRKFDFEDGMNTVAIAPPLIITKKEIQELIDILDDALTAVHKKWENA
ncbi:aspartate aminotransferase family protein [Natribacillus halophilus]|uniref:Putrescine aminotransferase n=1 Tax=Natribacillus halophilus TaxID=549003 RepID=A0A1G8JWX5_9BACI|nr:aspartate aminotransferase family protein [Natribacillus halophilus]SDI35689.1 putrescine aminotransferase [Natribacillus halophilus]